MVPVATNNPRSPIVLYQELKVQHRERIKGVLGALLLLEPQVQSPEEAAGRLID